MRYIFIFFILLAITVALIAGSIGILLSSIAKDELTAENENEVNAIVYAEEYKVKRNKNAQMFMQSAVLVFSGLAAGVGSAFYTA